MSSWILKSTFVVNQVFKSIISYNGLLRRFIPKAIAINNYHTDEISFVEDWYKYITAKNTSMSHVRKHMYQPNILPLL